jgi:hypothetical protein
MASILKTLAFAAGAGVAIGICTVPAGRRAPLRTDDVLDIEPVLDRLESIERRYELAIQAKSAQDAEIALLRQMVDTRGAEIQSRLEAEMEARHRQTLAAIDATIEKTVEFRVSERIAAIERSLGEQSVSIEALRERSTATDANLQRLIVAIEKLCERVPAPAPLPLPAVAPGPVLMPFEAHLRDASQRQESRSESFPQFRSKIFREDTPEPVAVTPEPKKVRFPLARIFGMLALVFLTQVLSS